MSLILLYGKPGSGKTTMACTMTKLGYKVLLLDADVKAHSMEHLKPLIQAGKVIVHPLKSRLSVGKLKTRVLTPGLALKKQPKGYLEFVELIDQWEEAMDAGEKPPADVLTIDSITAINEHMNRLMMHLGGRDKMTFDEHGAALSNWEELFSALQKIEHWFTHIIVIAHETSERDELTGKIDTLPLIVGSFRYKIAQKVVEAYHLRVKEKKGEKPTYMSLTHAGERYTARTSRNLEVEVQSDFGVIYANEKNRQTEVKPAGQLV